MMKAIYLYLEF